MGVDVRADHLLVQRGLATSRSAAARLIARGAVRWRAGDGWQAPRKAGDELPEACEIEVVDDAETRWASRAGLKLDAALQRCGIAVDGRIALDLGQSTGGFTDVLLARGAQRVVGVDVGHGQLVDRLRVDPRVRVFEGLNARHLNAAALADAMPPHGFDIVVGDLSFISLTLVLPAPVPLLAPGADVVLLVKPQFELQPADIGKGGIVSDPAAHRRVETRLRQAVADAGLAVRDWFESAVTGGDGNTEFFIWGRRA